MREITFRAWLIEKEKMVTPSTINYNRGYGGALEIYVDNPEFNPYRDIVENPDSDIQPFFSYINHSLEVHIKTRPHEFVLMQFTGMKTESKEEIYEGDVIEISGYHAGNHHPFDDEGYEYIITGYVVYIPSKGFCLKRIKTWDTDNDEEIKMPNKYAYITQIRSKKIGNIYDNPELLKK